MNNQEYEIPFELFKKLYEEEWELYYHGHHSTICYNLVDDYYYGYLNNSPKDLKWVSVTKEGCCDAFQKVVDDKEGAKMLGKPKYSDGEKVSFIIDNKKKIGYIYIIDEYGTFTNNSDVSYDILVTEENCLYKHIPEKWVEKV